MANISSADAMVLENFLVMEQGRVLNFSHSTLARHIRFEIKVDINNNKYLKYGESNANRMRTLWEIEDDNKVGTLISSLIEYRRTSCDNKDYKQDDAMEEKCAKIAERLKMVNTNPYLDEITFPINDSDFELLCKTIKDSIEKNEPELALDRFHTFYIKYIRGLCRLNNIDYYKREPLNLIFDKYVQFLEQKKVFESDLSNQILKDGINLLEKFNHVRNNQTFAHDNKLLNRQESLYIFDTLVRLKGFIDFIQNSKIKEIKKTNIEVIDFNNMELPF